MYPRVLSFASLFGFGMTPTPDVAESGLTESPRAEQTIPAEDQPQGEE